MYLHIESPVVLFGVKEFVQAIFRPNVIMHIFYIIRVLMCVYSALRYFPTLTFDISTSHSALPCKHQIHRTPVNMRIL